MTVTVPYLYVNDFSPMQTVDTGLRRIAAFAGLFDVKTPDVFASSLDFTSGGTFESGFYVDDSNEVTMSSYTVEFDQNESAADWYWMALREPVSGKAYFVGSHTDRTPIVYYYSGSGLSVAYRMPDITIAQYSHVRISVRKTIFGSDTNRVWLTISMWIDEEFIFEYFAQLPFSVNAETVMSPARYNGGAVGNRIYTDLTVKEMGDVIDSIAIDPNEPAFPAFQRATEGYYLRYFMRGTNELTFIRPKTQSSQMTLGADRSDPATVSKNQQVVKTHIRLLGATTQEEFVGTDLFYRFAEINNPFLMTSQECLTEAEAVYNRLKSESEILSVSHPVNPVLELEDRITTPEGDWIITGLGLNINNMHINQQISARKYIYE